MTKKEEEKENTAFELVKVIFLYIIFSLALGALLSTCPGNLPMLTY